MEKGIKKKLGIGVLMAALLTVSANFGIADAQEDEGSAVSASEALADASELRSLLDEFCDELAKPAVKAKPVAVAQAKPVAAMKSKPETVTKEDVAAYSWQAGNSYMAQMMKAELTEVNFRSDYPSYSSKELVQDKRSKYKPEKKKRHKTKKSRPASTFKDIDCKAKMLTDENSIYIPYKQRKLMELKMRERTASVGVDDIDAVETDPHKVMKDMTALNCLEESRQETRKALEMLNGFETDTKTVKKPFGYDLKEVAYSGSNLRPSSVEIVDYEEYEKTSTNDVMINTGDRGNTDSVMIDYNPDEVSDIFVRKEFVTDVVLPAGESLYRVVLGDRERFKVETFNNANGDGSWHVYINPIQKDIQTNMILSTDKHNYQVRLVSGELFFPLVKWNMPRPASRIGQVAMSEGNIVMDVDDVNSLEFGYSVSRSASASNTPKQVFDDKYWNTYMVFEPGRLKSVNPVIFTTAANGVVKMVPFDKVNDSIVIHKVCTNYVLKIGNDTVKVQRKKKNI